ncbi:putative RNA polymerase II subunit B1 CTD phosphatase RPAP2, partial [Clarias magur]
MMVAGGQAAQVRTAEEEARRKEVLKETLREKLELERRALQVVERLLDDNVKEDFLIDCARLITPANYSDVVEERFIAKMCGYPVCSNRLTKFLTQQYKISTKTNKVYDITERKCFCSHFCFKASKYLEVQISKTPLWLRKEERPPEVKLLKQGDGGTSGLEIKLSDRPVSISDVENPISGRPGSQGGSSGNEDSDEEQGFVSGVVAREQQPQQQRRVRWGDLPRRHDGEKQTHAGDAEVTRVRRERDKHSDEVSYSGSVDETSELLQQVTLSDAPASPEHSLNTNLNISQVGMSRKTAAGLRNLLKSHGKASGEAPAVTLSLLESLTHTLMEWRTDETMRFLYGADYTSHTEAELQSVDDDDEEEEEELDEDDLEDVEKVQRSGRPSGGPSRPSAPAPDYEALRRETEVLEVRVHEVYRGARVQAEETQTQAVGEKTHMEERESVPPLPLVDSKAQRAIQRRIVVEKLCRSVRDVAGPLGVTMSEIINDVNAIVRTFRFTNINIIHKPPEWTLIAVILLSA